MRNWASRGFSPSSPATATPHLIHELGSGRIAGKVEDRAGVEVMASLGLGARQFGANRVHVGLRATAMHRGLSRVNGSPSIPPRNETSVNPTDRSNSARSNGRYNRTHAPPSPPRAIGQKRTSTPAGEARPAGQVRSRGSATPRRRAAVGGRSGRAESPAAVGRHAGNRGRTGHPAVGSRTPGGASPGSGYRRGRYQTRCSS